MSKVTQEKLRLKKVIRKPVYILFIFISISFFVAFILGGFMIGNK